MSGWYESRITLKVEAPFLSASLESRGFGVDVGQLTTDGDDGKLAVFPGSLIRGNLRHALKLLKTHDVDVERALSLFGAPGDEEENRGDIAFHDMISNRPVQPGDVTRIRIDDATGSVVKGMLATVEIPFPFGDIVTFEGKVRFFAESEVTAEEIAKTLSDAASQVRAIGAVKTAGFGRVERFEVHSPGQAIIPSEIRSFEAGDARRFTMRFTVSGHLLVDAERSESNVLTGRDAISGAALKGALARRLTAGAGSSEVTGPLRDALTNLHIGFARPVGWAPKNDFAAMKPARSPELGASAVAKGLGERLGELGETGEAPAVFSSSWKEQPADAATQEEIRWETRTRLEVDEASGAAKEGRLFTQTFIVDPSRQELEFECRLVASGGMETSDLSTLLGAVNSGLPYLGKFAAAVQNISLLADDQLPRENEKVDDRIVLSLLSPHRMVRADDMHSESALHEAVNRYFDEVGDGAVRLSNDDDGAPLFFAEQEVRNGYQAIRFANKTEGIIEPFILMKAGSVFVLDVIEPTIAEKKLRDWLELGLPDLQINGREPTFEQSPFLRSNGYGEVALREEGGVG